MFFADIRRIGDHGDWYGMLNSDHMGHGPDPNIIMARIDEEIVRRVRDMTGPYKLVLARVKSFAQRG